MVEMICQSRRGFVRLAVLCAFFFCTAAAGASSLTPSPSEEAQATLDADAIRYDETTSIAVAEGNVVLHYQDLTVHAGRMVMYADTGLVQAFAEDKGKVVLERAKGETLAGSFVEYHLQSSSGFMEGARASVPVGKGLLYISGTKTEVKSADEAQRAKWVNGKYLRRVSPDALVNRWIDASYTTCRLESDPHYKMMSKRLVVVPGKYVVLQRPRFYAGKSYLFASPFNVALRQDGRRNGQITIR
ncbi:MAG: LptA/OstA family protein, partial [Pyramidobacter sp.]|nr:LptA/OstA family protein [Pyramidobacter sp.]